MTATTTALISACIAAGAALTALYAARGNSTREGFELARTAYNGLTGQEVAEARSSLERYRRGSGDDAPDVVLDRYFMLLWQFEQIHAARQALDRQRFFNGTRPAVRFLDEMIDWHVQEWAARWLEIRTKLEADRNDEIDDEHTLSTFSELLKSVAPNHWRLEAFEAVIAPQRTRRAERERRARVGREQARQTPGAAALRADGSHG